MEALERWGGESELDAVLRRVKVILSKPRKIGQHRMSELMYGISFLQRVGNDRRDVKVLLESLLNLKADRLFKHEAEWLSKQVAGASENE